MGEHDVVVAGAGHNSLVCAAYLARAGLRVLVLERAARIGGDTSTEELTLPGFLHDACASAHTIFQSSPIVRDDELELGRYGLRYLFPDPVVVMPFADGRSITMSRERAATVRDLARFSARDARAYEQLLDDWDGIKGIIGAARYTPLLEARMPSEPAPDGPDVRRWRSASALEIIDRRFEDEHVRAFMAWLSLMTMGWIDRPGTGLLPFSIASGRQTFSWTTPVGGSVALPDALAAIVVERGGEVRTSSEVVRVIVEGGRAAGVVTADGAEHRASRAVVSTIHTQHLPRAVGADRLGPAFMAGLERWRTGVTMFVTHCALDEAPLYRCEQGPTASVAAAILGSVGELREALAALRAGVARTERAPLLVISSSVADPSRAPAGRHTWKVVGFQPYELRDGGPARWDEIKERVADELVDRALSFTANLSRANVLARHVESPLDLERRNPHNYRGSCHAGDTTELVEDGVLLPMPHWVDHRLPVAGLYQTGSTTHPGASVTGAPGRNCAQVVLGDLGISFASAHARR